MKYNIKIVSLTNSIFFVLIIVPLFMSIIFLSGKLRASLFVVLPIILCFIPLIYFSWQRFVTGRTEWTITDDEVSMTWIKQFAFTNKEDIDIQWIEIESIGKLMFDGNYYNLKIKLVSGKKIIIHHDYFITKDDFGSFIKNLYQTYNDTKISS